MPLTRRLVRPLSLLLALAAPLAFGGCTDDFDFGMERPAFDLSGTGSDLATDDAAMEDLMSEDLTPGPDMGTGDAGEDADGGADGGAGDMGPDAGVGG